MQVFLVVLRYHWMSRSPSLRRIAVLSSTGSSSYSSWTAWPLSWSHHHPSKWWSLLAWCNIISLKICVFSSALWEPQILQRLFCWRSYFICHGVEPCLFVCPSCCLYLECLSWNKVLLVDPIIKYYVQGALLVFWALKGNCSRMG